MMVSPVLSSLRYVQQQLMPRIPHVRLQLPLHRKGCRQSASVLISVPVDVLLCAWVRDGGKRPSRNRRPLRS